MYCPVDLGLQRGNSGCPCRARRPLERSLRLHRPDAPHGDPGTHQFVSRPGHRWQGVDLDSGQHLFGPVELPDQKQVPGLEEAGIGCIYPVAMGVEHGPRRPKEVQ